MTMGLQLSPTPYADGEEEEGVTECTSSYAATNSRMEGYGRNDNGTATEPHTFGRLKSTLRVLF
jgi:hypothetical protein